MASSISALMRSRSAAGTAAGKLFSGIASGTWSEFVDAGVTTGTIGEVLVFLIEEKGDRILVAHVGQGQTTEVNSVLLVGLQRGFFGLGDDLLDEGTEGFSLREGGLDPAVGDEGGGHVGHHRFTVRSGNA